MTSSSLTRSSRQPRDNVVRRRHSPILVLIIVLVATLSINVETTVVNVALPTLSTALKATTGELQWIVDAYNVSFAALVLAGGTIGDRWGRRGVLVVGLALFAASSTAAGLSATTAELIGFRFGMGAASALIFPTTLAIITDTFRAPRARAAAIGAWGGVGGLGVAVGPIVGGALLRAFDWGSLFLALVPLAVVAAIGAVIIVPRSQASNAVKLDRVGLLLSVVALGSLVYTIIEAPTRGWTNGWTILGFAVALLAIGGFVAFERRAAAPLVDISLFANLRFSAASASVTVAFFGLFGFIFLITQYLQQLQNLDPLTTGVRTLPVAVSIAVGSIGGTRLAHTRLGTKVVVTVGLCLLAIAFIWASTARVDTPYEVIAEQMILLGGGLGLTTAPATDSVMSVVRPAQAGAGSAVNDAARQVGGTLGVAVVGSIYATLYSQHLTSNAVFRALPDAVRSTANVGLAQGLAVARQLPPELGATLKHAVQTGFLAGLHAGCLTTAAVCAAGAVLSLILLPGWAKLPISTLEGSQHNG